MTNYRRIGILGGMSPESTAEFYDLLAKKHYERHHDYNYPEMVIFSVNFAAMIALQESGDKETYTAELIKGIRALEAAGAELIVIASNTPHMVFDRLKTHAKAQLLGIPGCVRQQAEQLGLKKLLLLGTKFTMQATFYQDEFKDSGIDVLVPNEVEQADINRIIYDELVIGDFKDESKRRLLDIMHSYTVDGVILGCTELPLIIKPEDTVLKLLDTIEIYANATIREAKYDT